MGSKPASSMYYYTGFSYCSLLSELLPPELELELEEEEEELELLEELSLLESLFFSSSVPTKAYYAAFLSVLSYLCFLILSNFYWNFLRSSHITNSSLKFIYMALA